MAKTNQMDKVTVARINKEVRLWLNRQRISREDAAARLGLTPASLSVYLAGRPFTESRARRWAAAFGLSERFLLTGQGPVVKRASSYRTLVDENERLRAIIKEQEREIDALRNGNTLSE